jgi:glutamate racemase
LSNSLSRRSLRHGRNRPVGIFDSGIGGLSIALEIRRELPHERLLYVADSGYAPYGDQPSEFIERRALAIVDFFVQKNAKAVVVACNTATAVAVDALRARWSMPIVAIEPAVKPAAAASRSGVVGVLATTQTIASTRFERLADTFGRDVEILAQPCPGLVDRIEAGDLSGTETRRLVHTYVAPLIEKGADTLVLGCTHYPLVRDLIEHAAGPGVTIIDPAAAVARELRRRLADKGLLAGDADPGSMSFLTTGEPAHMKEVLGRLGVEPGLVQRVP